jgi:spore photoproduct lyase family protein
MWAVAVSPAVAVTPIDRLLQVDTIYVEPAAAALPRGQEVLARFPGAERIEVPSHWQIPGLHGNEGNVGDWNRIKRTHLVLGTLKSPRLRPNGRSSDFIAPSQANGCAMSCAYCYVPRRKGFANPITVFANTEQILRATERHIARQGRKAEPNQCDPVDWVYDIGENSDCSVDAWVSGSVRDYVELFARTDGAKASFATKAVNPELLAYDPRGGTRVRFSLMPRDMSRLVDVRTHPVEHRIAAIDAFVEAGYEVHVNLSPVIVAPGWLEAWDELLGELDAGTGPAAKAQMAAEVIFLTHNDRLHEVNLGWHPRAEEVLWTPETQEPKRSQTGGWNVRYRSGWKGARVRELLALVERRTPWLRVRYAF